MVGVRQSLIDNGTPQTDIDGFIVQLPLPEHISVEKVTESEAKKF